MMAISEVKLWSERICQKLTDNLSLTLSSGERESIFNAVEAADQTRYRLTQKYINFVTESSRGTDLIRLPDYQIWQELIQSREELMGAAKISLDSLARLNGSSLSLLNSLSMVWAMYSEPYFRNLKKSGYISGKTFLLAESASHGIPASATESEFINRVYREIGVYFDRDGINPNTGYAAFIGCIDSNGKNARRTLELGNIPNLANWQQWLENGRLAPNNNLNLNLKENQLLLWGLNLMPFDSGVQQAILKLSDIKAQFNQVKMELSRRFSGRDAQAPIEELRKTFTPQIYDQNQALAGRLGVFFKYLTT